MSLRRAAIIALALAFAALAALVCAGSLTRLDQWGVDHLMPGADFRGTQPTVAESLVPLLGAHWDTWLGGVANIVTLPASFLLSLAIVAWRSRLLAVALLAAVAVEVVCKELIERPALYAGAFHISAFDSSFPSGHTLRTILVAAAVWPLLRGWAVAWALASIALLQLAAWHTPTDVLGGVLLGLVACASAGIHSRGFRHALKTPEAQPHARPGRRLMFHIKRLALLGARGAGALRARRLARA